MNEMTRTGLKLHTLKGIPKTKPKLYSESLLNSILKPQKIIINKENIQLSPKSEAYILQNNRSRKNIPQQA